MLTLIKSLFNGIVHPEDIKEGEEIDTGPSQIFLPSTLSNGQTIYTTPLPQVAHLK